MEETWVGSRAGGLDDFNVKSVLGALKKLVGVLLRCGRLAGRSAI